jgi:predicted GH43/DUF377 family glycosyl hydrolase
MTVLVRRGSDVLQADPSRIVSRFFQPGNATRIDGIIQRILTMTDEQVTNTLAATEGGFSARHDDLPGLFAEHFGRVASHVPGTVSAERRDLIGAYFTHEYSIEAAALFNPSIVAHPDQTGLAAGQLRFVMSVRAVGEGHISSIEFRTGVLTGDTVRIDDPGRHLVTGRATPLPMSPEFLRNAVAEYGDVDSAERTRWLESCNYRLRFDAGRPLTERVIFPTGPDESNGVEDARFTEFVEDDGGHTYFATYTAFDGSDIAPHLLRTDDFETFEISRLIGPAAKNKGMALFPRRVGGSYLALSRWDQESIGIASSADARRWGDPITLVTPGQPWELIQLGNCGSPIETPDGWLVLTHGVGPMRTYAIGAILLDLAEPTKVLGALSEPLLTASDSERDGYVPNVVYSCGALVHDETLVLPYGCSDSAIRFAFVDLPELLHELSRA